LSGYPADFRFPEGASLAKVWKVVGNSVPPPMARAWAEKIRDALLERAPSVA
jgi:site-specific DNA-cytosine methylase